jgi:hypothetical protein
MPFINDWPCYEFSNWPCCSKCKLTARLCRTTWRESQASRCDPGFGFQPNRHDGKLRERVRIARPGSATVTFERDHSDRWLGLVWFCKVNVTECWSPHKYWSTCHHHCRQRYTQSTLKPLPTQAHCVAVAPKVWTVDKELKGWTAAQKKFFDAGQVSSYTVHEMNYQLYNHYICIMYYHYY